MTVNNNSNSSLEFLYRLEHIEKAHFLFNFIIRQFKKLFIIKFRIGILLWFAVAKGVPERYSYGFKTFVNLIELQLFVRWLLNEIEGSNELGSDDLLVDA